MSVLTGHCIDAEDNNECGESGGGIGIVEEIVCYWAYFRRCRSQYFDQTKTIYLGGRIFYKIHILYRKYGWPVLRSQLAITQYKR